MRRYASSALSRSDQPVGREGHAGLTSQQFFALVRARLVAT